MKQSTRPAVTLLLAYLLCVVAIGLVLETREVVRVQRDLEILQRVHAVLRGPLRADLIRLRQDLLAPDTTISPYRPHLAVTDRIEGPAGSSLSVRGLCIDTSPEMRWLLRGMGFAWAVLDAPNFADLDVITPATAGFLLRLTAEEATSLDDNLTMLWQRHSLDPAARGNPRAFSDFQLATEVHAHSPSIRAIRKLPDREFGPLYPRMRDFIYEHLGYKPVPGGTAAKVPVAQKAIRDHFTAKVPFQIPLVGELSLPRIALEWLHPIAITLTSYLGLAWWRQGQRRQRAGATFRVGWLLDIDEIPKLLNFCACTLILLPILTTLALLLWNASSPGLRGAHGAALAAVAWAILALDVFGTRERRAIQARSAKRKTPQEPS